MSHNLFLSEIKAAPERYELWLDWEKIDGRLMEEIDKWVPRYRDIFEAIPNLRREKAYPSEAIIEAQEHELEDAAYTLAFYTALTNAMCRQLHILQQIIAKHVPVPPSAKTKHLKVVK